jgi:hypothetical protein
MSDGYLGAERLFTPFIATWGRPFQLSRTTCFWFILRRSVKEGSPIWFWFANRELNSLRLDNDRACAEFEAAHPGENAN